VVTDIENGLGARVKMVFPHVMVACSYLKVAEELNEFSSGFFLVRGRRFTSRETYADRILDPKHIGQVHPRIGIDTRRILAPGPLDPAILLEEAFERAAAWDIMSLGAGPSQNKCSCLPGPPLNQMVISSTGGPTRGWKMKNMPRESSDMLRGMTPEYISVMKLLGTSGSAST
jgi:hypothetical protein